MTSSHRYRVYGIELRSDLPFSWLEDCRLPDDAPDGTADDPPRAHGGAPPGPASARVQLRTVPGALPEQLAGRLGQGVPIEGDDALDSPITFHPVDAATVVRFHGAADHVVESAAITCYLPDEQLLPLVQVQLLGTVLAVWLERHGVTTLHASVVEIDGGAVALLGAPGGGKTTLAAALVAAGARFVVDDLAALDATGPRLAVHAGYPVLRLWPEQAEVLAGGTEGLATVHPWYDKLAVPLERLAAGGAPAIRTAARPVPLQQVLLPRRGTAEQDVAFERLATGAGLQALVANAFLPGPVHGLGLAGGRLPTLARLLSETPVSVLRYPTGFDRLPAVGAAVSAHGADN